MTPQQQELRLLLSPASTPVMNCLRLLAARCDLAVVEFDTGVDVELLTEAGDAGIVAFESLLPDMTGPQLANWLETFRPSLVPLVAVRATDARTAIRLASDTRAVVVPDSCEELELWEALTSARARALSGKAYHEARGNLVRRIESCTDEELKILRRWARGQTNKQIASETDISMRTLNMRKNSILNKLDVDNIVEAVWELSKYTEFDRFSFFPSRRMEIAAHSPSFPNRTYPEPRSATG
ncbi:MAG: LuxR C-terminal-related transcriptional regulator [Planctomycetota bacterium]